MAEEKKALRAVCRQKRSLIENKEERSRLIVGNILGLSELKDAESLFLFYPLSDEVDLLPLFEYAVKACKKVGFPLCEDKDGAMTFRRVYSLDELVSGSFGTKEPRKDAPLLLPKNALILLPALAADKKGYRLGYGKGYYDRYLDSHKQLSPSTVTVIFKELLVDAVPTDRFDVPCQKVVFEDGIITPQAPQKIQEA